MPELPEVTTVIGILKNEVLNKKITKVDVFYPRMIQSPLDEFKTKLVDKKILNITRKGKFIIFHLEDNLVLLSHLRMEGKYYFGEEKDKNPQFTHVVFHFETNEKLCYFDTRKFGIMKLSSEDRVYKELPLSKLGPEPMEVNSQNIEQVYKNLSRKKPIKELITDQSVLAGIGNIYADEICYKCKIHPLTLGSQLNKEKYDEIIKFASEILTKAIELGGSTIKSYHPKEGVDGRFQILLQAYGHEGDLCPNCGTKFHKIFLNGRGTTFCPNCQVDLTLKKAIGITGPIGAGKSEICKILADRGYFVVSSDQIVKNLYELDSTKKLLERHWNISSFTDENNHISFAKIREIITKNPAEQKYLESVLHPLVEEELIKQVKMHNENIVLEIPLLFKAHLEYLCKKIIFVTADRSVLLNRIKERNYANPEAAIDLYFKDNDFKNNPDVIVIKNDSTKEKLTSDIESLVKNI